MRPHDLVVPPLPIKEGDQTYIGSFNADTQKEPERQDNLTELTVSKCEALEVFSGAKGMEKDFYGHLEDAALWLASMLPVFLTASILSAWCLTESTCLSHDDLKELKTEFAISLYQHLARAENGSSLVLSSFPGAAAVGSPRKHFCGAARCPGIQHSRCVCHKPPVSEFQLSPRFAARAARWANGSLQQANFSDPGAAAARVRHWMSSSTGDGNVPSMSLDTAPSPLNQVLVVSTMYFKSTWQKKFSFMDTQILPFTTAEGSTLGVPTMHHTAEVNYGQFQTASLEALSVLELPYVGEEISMFVLLPGHKSTSLSRLESQLSAKAVALWASSLKRMKMDVFLPRFSIQSNFDLKIAFSALGITDIFDPIKADFRGISEQGSLYVSEAIHKAKIEVAEDGTKASGATAMVLLKRSRTPVFKADRPFTFFLRQANTGSVLFIGRVTNPSQ
ncbi:PREDICTED: serpin E3 [Tinamus guttatus]|uniref:serpin E3 n=1 Tax=Tinamus guttatus TaxID=94827 RepID=UPI00052EB659|nr:PREDICTED: serpin E3 [Tinamus guttatus]